MGYSTRASATRRGERQVAVSAVQTRTGPVALTEHKPRSFASVVRHRLGRSYHAISGATILGAIILAALFAPIVAPDDPLTMTMSDQFLSPSLEHPFGTDEFGRDILSRVIHGA